MTQTSSCRVLTVVSHSSQESSQKSLIYKSYAFQSDWAKKETTKLKCCWFHLKFIFHASVFCVLSLWAHIEKNAAFPSALEVCELERCSLLVLQSPASIPDKCQQVERRGRTKQAEENFHFPPKPDRVSENGKMGTGKRAEENRHFRNRIVSKVTNGGAHEKRENPTDIRIFSSHARIFGRVQIFFYPSI